MKSSFHVQIDETLVTLRFIVKQRYVRTKIRINHSQFLYFDQRHTKYRLNQQNTFSNSNVMWNDIFKKQF